MHKKVKLHLNQPILILLEASILDLATHVMYDFHLQPHKKEYGNNVDLCCTDADSLILFIQTDDIYRNLEKNKTSL